MYVCARPLPGDSSVAVVSLQARVYNSSLATSNNVCETYATVGYGYGPY